MRLAHALALALMTLAGVARANDCLTPPDGFKAREGGHVSNGGDALVHRQRNGAPDSVEMYDLYEYRVGSTPTMTPDLGGQDVSVEDKVAMMLARVERLDRLRAARYRAWAERFFAEACFRANVVLPDVNDSHHMDVPAGEGYAVEQIAIQQEPIVPERPRYTVNLDLWNVMDRDNRAALVLHELIYRDGIVSNIGDSRGVRFLVGALASDYLRDWTFQRYAERMTSFGFLDVSYDGLWLDARLPMSFHPNGSLQQAHVRGEQDYESRWGRLRLQCEIAYTEAGALRAFNLTRADGATITVGGRELVLGTRRAVPTCAPRPNDVGTPFDVDLADPENPEFGAVAIASPSTVQARADSYAATLSGPFLFVDGMIERARAAGQVDGSSYVSLQGMRCLLTSGEVHFQRYPDRPSQFPVSTCTIPFPRYEGLHLKGDIEVRAQGNGLAVARGTMANSSLITLNADNRLVLCDELRFDEAGNIVQATLSSGKAVQRADGTRVDVPSGAQLWLDDFGYLERFVGE